MHNNPHSLHRMVQKHPVRNSSACGKCLLMRESTQRRKTSLIEADRISTVTQTTFYSQGEWKPRHSELKIQFKP